MCFSSAEGAADRRVTLANSTQYPVPSTQPPPFRRELGTEDWVLGTLVQAINREYTQQLGVEIGGLLGKHLAGKSDSADLLHAHRIHQERHLDLPALRLRQRFSGLATIRNVLLITNGFLRDLQNTFQQAF